MAEDSVVYMIPTILTFQIPLPFVPKIIIIFLKKSGLDFGCIVLVFSHLHTVV